MKNLKLIFNSVCAKKCLTFLFASMTFLGVTKASENSFLHLGLDLNYNTGSSISEEKKSTAVQDIAKLLNKSSDITITIFGFSDLTGNKSQDKKIAIQRAENIKKEIVSAGISAARITTSSLAEYDSIVKNKKVFGQRQNRKIVVRILNREIGQITEIINWSKSKKQISVVDPLGSKIKNLTLLTEMLRSQNSDNLNSDDNSRRMPASNQ